MYHHAAELISSGRKWKLYIYLLLAAPRMRDLR